jgi:hypothetical protein
MPSHQPYRHHKAKPYRCLTCGEVLTPQNTALLVVDKSARVPAMAECGTCYDAKAEELAPFVVDVDWLFAE